MTISLFPDPFVKSWLVRDVNRGKICGLIKSRHREALGLMTSAVLKSADSPYWQNNPDFAGS